VATAAGISNLRVTYSPLDFRWMVRSYLNRFEPEQIVLIEGEVWPHLLLACQKRGIPVRLVNARMSPRSARRFAKFAAWLRPIYGLLDKVAIQEATDAGIWESLGIEGGKIEVTGSLKFDPGSGTRPSRRPEFQQMIDGFGKGRPVVLAASTFQGEEVMIAEAIRGGNPAALPVIVPRHAERRAEVKTGLARAGFEVVLRSDFTPPAHTGTACLVVDSTGELRDWTAHADAVIIGKSFLSTGGQNPCEAILAEKPVIVGPHMENFQPLVSRLISSGGCIVAADGAELEQAILTALSSEKARAMTRAASDLLTHHDGATRRILEVLRTRTS
jgi:3-deoxy-D-manno-octulosonic-acid transferase